MTYEQAERAAAMRHPVMYRGIRYMRIEETGKSYPMRGGVVCYVVLKDRRCNSVVRTRPEEVELVGGEDIEVDEKTGEVSFRGR